MYVASLSLDGWWGRYVLLRAIYVITPDLVCIECKGLSHYDPLQFAFKL
jgi:hypothetical protein